MNSCIDEVFKKIPFFYLLEDEFYVLGTGVCEKFAGNFNEVLALFNKYIDACGKDIQKEEARKTIINLVSRAHSVRNNNSLCCNAKNQFSEFQFSDTVILDLEKQVNQFSEFFRKNRLNEYDWRF